MKGAAHTPGPWAVYCSDNKNDRPGIDADTKSVVIFGDSERLDDDSGVRGDTQEERIANARLIAAAPDLLIAAQWAEKALERYSDALGLSVDEAAPIALDKIASAISKATREPS